MLIKEKSFFLAFLDICGWVLGMDGITFGKKLLNIKNSLLSADIFMYRKLPLDVYYFLFFVSSACPLAACIIDEKQEAFS